VIPVTIASAEVISTILKHDSKVTSYKIALLRAINDVVLTKNLSERCGRFPEAANSLLDCLLLALCRFGPCGQATLPSIAQLTEARFRL
jgi:hypothetical protein